MAQYAYEGRRVDGKTVKGKMFGESTKEVVLNLKQKGVVVTDITTAKQTLMNKQLSFGSGVKQKDFSIYLRQFATLIRAGLSIVEATKVLSKQTESKGLQKTLQDIEGDIRTGQPLSEAAAKHPKVYPPMFKYMVQAGELSGNIDDGLEMLAVYFEKQRKTRQKMISALAYPVILLVVAFGVIIFLLSTVVPTFADMFASLDAELPVLTQMVMTASDFVQKFWWLLIILFVGCVGLLGYLKNHPSTKYYFDYAMLKIPIFGSLLQKAALARMSRTLCSLFYSSVPVLQAMSIIEKIVLNEVMADVIRKAKAALEQGGQMSEAMKEHWVFPPLVVNMIMIGEKSGSLDAMLDKVADFYEDEVDQMSERLKSLMEPLMIIFLAGIVGVIVLAVMIPMFEMFTHF